MKPILIQKAFDTRKARFDPFENFEEKLGLLPVSMEKLSYTRFIICVVRWKISVNACMPL